MHKELTPQQMEEALKKASEVGPNHKRLDPLVGIYKVTAKFWKSPKGEPEVTTGMADFAWALDGHYILMNYASTFNGRPFKGIGMFGYSNSSQEYQSLWIDTMGIDMMMSKGNFDKDGNLVFNGEFKCPVTDNTMTTREVLRIGNGRHVYEMFHPAMDGSGDFKAMEITYEIDPAAGKPTTKMPRSKK
jgi:hypothetical protein